MLGVVPSVGKGAQEDPTPQLRAGLMPRATPPVAPFTASTPVMIREVYPMLYAQLVQQQQHGVGGEMLLGSPGVGMRTFGDYVMKRSVPGVRPCRLELSAVSLQWLVSRSRWSCRCSTLKLLRRCDDSRGLAYVLGVWCSRTIESSWRTGCCQTADKNIASTPVLLLEPEHAR